MFSILLLFALAASSPAKDRPCPPAGFEHVSYVDAHGAAELAPMVQHQLGGNLYWSGPAGLEARPETVNVDVFIDANGKVAGVCGVSGERHVFAAVAKELMHLKLPARALILPLNLKLVWHSTRTDQDLQEFRAYDLEVTPAARP